MPPIAEPAQPTPSGVSVTAADQSSSQEFPRKRGRRRRYNPEQVIAAVWRANGVTTVAGRLLGCSASTVTSYVRSYPEVHDAFMEVIAKRYAVKQ